MAGFDLVGRLFSMVRDRDGQARVFEQMAKDAGPYGPSPLSDPERDIRIAIATKLLEGWLAGRRRTRLPHTLNFRVLKPGQGALLVAVMAAAAQADGQVGAEEERRIPLALRRVGAGDAEITQAETALHETQNLGALLARVQEEGLAAHAYAAALMAVSRRTRPNRTFLDYLGARLGLDIEDRISLELRYRA